MCVCDPTVIAWVHRQAQAVRELQLTMVLVKRRDDLPDLPKLNHWQDRMCAYCLKEQTSGAGTGQGLQHAGWCLTALVGVASAAPGYFGKGEWSYYCHYTELMYVVLHGSGCLPRGIRGEMGSDAKCPVRPRRLCLCRFCKSCFGNRKHRIPWRVIHRMDDKAYPVRGVAGCGSPHPMLPRLTRCGRRCQVADVVYPYLEVMCKAGVVDLIKYNRDRWGNDESWLDLVEIRKHLAAAKVGAHAGSDRSMGDGLLSAPPPPAVRDVPVPVSCDGAQLKAHPTQGVAKLEEVLPGADYMWRNTKMVSVNDIACVRASV